MSACSGGVGSALAVRARDQLRERVDRAAGEGSSISRLHVGSDGVEECASRGQARQFRGMSARSEDVLLCAEALLRRSPPCPFSAGSHLTLRAFAVREPVSLTMPRRWLGRVASDAHRTSPVASQRSDRRNNRLGSLLCLPASLAWPAVARRAGVPRFDHAFASVRAVRGPAGLCRRLREPWCVA